MSSPVLDRRRFLAGLAAAPLVACTSGSREPAGRLPSRSAATVHANARPALLAARPSTDGNGARVFRLFPQVPGDHHDPFVLLDDFAVAPPAGFPLHPHRGFEAFTYMIDGAFHHRDTLGNDSVVTSGGTQRFTSGRGAHHSEMPAAEQVNRGLQLWVNLPPELKQMDPEYEAIHGPDLPEVARRDVVEREIVGSTSHVRLRTAVTYLDLDARARTRWEHEVPAGANGLVYVLEGTAKVGDVDVAAKTAAILTPGGVEVLAERGTRFVFLAGAAHGAPIHHHGPFVD
ncbi:MAG: pirin family protein [Sandaracinaceae bacterium]